MLKFTKAIAAFGAVAALAVMAPQAAHAGLAFAIAGDNTSNTNVFYTGGVAGSFNLNIPNGFLKSKLFVGLNKPNVRIIFSPLTGVGAVGYNFFGIAQSFDQVLTGGSFKIIDNPTGTVWLSGTFSNAILHGRNNSSSLSLTLLNDSVLYTTTAPFIPAGMSPQAGSFAIEFVAAAPVVATPASAGAFKANDGMTFGLH